MIPQLYPEALAVSILFASVFLFGRWFQLPLYIRRHQRKVLSFSAGIAVAYVFIHLLPELASSSFAFADSQAAERLLLPELRVYFAAMCGFLCFYGLEHWVSGNRVGEDEENRAFLGHIFGFAAYVWLVSYLQVRGVAEKGETPRFLYAIAMSFHFLATDHSLRREHGSRYDSRGRFILAAAAVFGWFVGVLVDLPLGVSVTLLGLIAGGVIVNSVIAELPGKKDGRFWPFVAGGFFYSLMLVPLG